MSKVLWHEEVNISACRMVLVHLLGLLLQEWHQPMARGVSEESICEEGIVFKPGLKKWAGSISEELS